MLDFFVNFLAVLLPFLEGGALGLDLLLQLLLRLLPLVDLQLELGHLLGEQLRTVALCYLLGLLAFCCIFDLSLEGLVDLLQFLDGVTRLLEHVLLLLAQALRFLHLSLQLIDLLMQLLHFSLQDGVTLLVCHNSLFFFLYYGVQLSDILLLFLSFAQGELRKPSKLAEHLLDLIEMGLVLVCR